MRALLPVVLALPLCSVAGELRVIHDAGGTLALRPLAQASGLKAPAGVADPGAGEPSRSSRFPLQTPELSAGTVRRRATGPRGEALPRPLFVVGDDARSLDWLATHRERLASIAAAGLLVEAGDAAGFERVAAVAEGLPLAAVPGGDVARLFGLSHYPVLIGPEWIEQ